MAFYLLMSPLVAAYTQIDGVWSNELYAPVHSAGEHFDEGNRLLLDKKYDEALRDFLVILHHFSDTTFYADALFHSGVCYYYMGHLDIADRQFTHYLNQKGTLKHFEKVFNYKFEIAEQYRNGKKKHPFGIATLPRMAPAKNDAIALYDEIIATLPGRTIAAQALFGKGLLLRKKRERKESIEVFQMLTRRFPKHALAADAYEQIAQIYVDSVKKETQNPDFLSLAKLNFQNFEKSFPSDDRVAVLEGYMQEMKEIYAGSLFETGRFYEKKKKPLAAKIYYKETIQRYPDTEAAAKSQRRLDR